MVLIQPTNEELNAACQKAPYQVIQKDNTAHVVADKQTGITAYAAFDTYQPKMMSCSFPYLPKHGNA